MLARQTDADPEVPYLLSVDTPLVFVDHKTRKVPTHHLMSHSEVHPSTCDGKSG